MGATAALQSPAKRCILLIVDNEADANLTKIVHDEVKQCSWLDIVYDGDEAIRYLREEDTRPDLILMDMALPMKSGLEMIGLIRALAGCNSFRL
jgi:DNA-binding response OmpR family regulator